MKRKLTRREFLRGAAVTSVGLVAAACAPAVAPTTAPAPAPTTVPPTAATGATAVPTKAAAATVAPPTVTVPAVRKPVTVQLMDWGGPDRFKTRVDLFKKTFPETASWLNIEIVSPGTQDVDVNNAFRLALSAGRTDLPDIVHFNYSSVTEFARAGALYDLKSLMAPFWGDMTAGAKLLAVADGKNVVVPMQVNGKVWYYRKDMFEKAGIDTEKVKTLDDYVAAGKKLHEAFPKSYIMNMGPQPFYVWYFTLLSHWDDAQITDQNGNYQVAKNPRFGEMFTMLKTFYASGINLKVDDWSTDWQPAFGDGSIAGCLIHTWFHAYLPTFAPAQKGLWGTTLHPDFNRYGSGEGGSVWCIPKAAKNPEAAFEFLSKLFLTPEGSVGMWNLAGLVPCSTKGVQTVGTLVKDYKRPDGLTDKQWDTNPANFFGPTVMDASFKSMDVVKVYPFTPKYQAELDIMRKHCEAFMADKETLQQALAGAQSDMEKQIGNPWKS